MLNVGIAEVGPLYATAPVSDLVHNKKSKALSLGYKGFALKLTLGTKFSKAKTGVTTPFTAPTTEWQPVIFAVNLALHATNAIPYLESATPEASVVDG